MNPDYPPPYSSGKAHWAFDLRSPKQRALILALCRQLERDVEDICAHSYKCRLDDLSTWCAASLIDWLKQQAAKRAQKQNESEAA